jgi:hypothetical protein
MLPATILSNGPVARTNEGVAPWSISSTPHSASRRAALLMRRDGGLERWIVLLGHTAVIALYDPDHASFVTILPKDMKRRGPPDRENLDGTHPRRHANRARVSETPFSKNWTTEIASRDAFQACKTHNNVLVHKELWSTRRSQCPRRNEPKTQPCRCSMPQSADPAHQALHRLATHTGPVDSLLGVASRAHPNMTLRQMLVLRHIASTRGMLAKDVFAELGIARSALYRAIVWLAHRHLVTAPARGFVRATAAGRVLSRQIVRNRIDIADAARIITDPPRFEIFPSFRQEEDRHHG